MKRIYLLFLIFCSIISNLSAQDLLTLKTGEDIQVKIFEINKTSVIYRRFDNLDGPIYTVDKNEVLIIRYANGTKDIFINNSNNSSIEKTPTAKDTNFYELGVYDAFYNYKGYKNASTGTFVTTIFLSPLAGLIPAISCSMTPPKEYNYNFPNATLMKNYDYKRGYSDQANQMKTKKVWQNFGIAFGINLGLLILLFK